MNYSILKILGLFFLMLTISSCSPDPEEDNPIIDVSTIETELQSNIWKITKFIDSEKDETSHFKNFEFTFNADQTITATNGSITYEGKWSLANHHHSSGQSSDMEFNIIFDSPKHFEELSEDWDISLVNNSSMEFIHISGGNGGTDYLNFEKI